MALDTDALVTELARELHDEARVRWTDEHWAEYLISALQQLALIHPEAFERMAAVSLQEGPLHHIPEDGLRLIDVQTNIDALGFPGRAVTRTDGKTLDRFRPSWRHDSPRDEVEHFIWDDRQPTVYYTVPPVREGVRVILNYAQSPGEIAPGVYPEIQQLPDHYMGPLRHWMLYRARSTETSAAAKQEAASHYQWFFHSLGAQMPSTRRMDPRTQETDKQ